MSKRFERIYSQGNGLGTAISIWVDKETGVNYLAMWTGSPGGGGPTPLLDAEGKPIISKYPDCPHVR